MFEENTPVASRVRPDPPVHGPAHGQADSNARTSHDSALAVLLADDLGVDARHVLRTMDWGEVTARLNAARDLREELGVEPGCCTDGKAAATRFALAANRYCNKRSRAIASSGEPASLEAAAAAPENDPLARGAANDARDNDARDNDARDRA